MYALTGSHTRTHSFTPFNSRHADAAKEENKTNSPLLFFCCLGFQSKSKKVHQMRASKFFLKKLRLSNLEPLLHCKIEGGVDHSAETKANPVLLCNQSHLFRISWSGTLAKKWLSFSRNEVKLRSWTVTDEGRPSSSVGLANARWFTVRGSNPRSN